MMRTMRVWIVGFALMSSLPLSAVAGNGAFCCRCQGCEPGVSACGQFPTLPAEVKENFENEVCEPLGCIGGSGCLDAPCAERMDCPQSEVDQCDDGVDNNANGSIDCADSTCAEDPLCAGNAAPAMSWLGIGALAAGLVALGYRRLNKGRS